MYPAQQKATDQTANFFWVLCLLVGAVLLIWWLERDWIIGPIYWVRRQEIFLAVHLSAGWDHFFVPLGLPAIKMGGLSSLYEYLNRAVPEQETFANFAMMAAHGIQSL
jgi:intracellular multiplication protein IcmP